MLRRIFFLITAFIVENREYFHNNAAILPLYRNIASEGVRLNA